ncbi:MAG: DMT family transporter [Oceanospirillaceae bacterium]
MEIWIGFTLFAALMQAVRTAGQKRIAKYISPMATTLVRYIFGLPFAVAYLFYLGDQRLLQTIEQASGNNQFLLFAVAAAVSQIFATVWLVKVLSFKNFAVGTSFAKTEAIQTAILGALFFSAYLSFYGWLAVVLGVLGILVVSLPSKGQPLEKMTIFYGILSGIAFAFTSLWIRQGSLSLGDDLMFNAAITLVFMVSLQSIICFAYVYWREYEQLIILKKHLKLALFVGATSAFGSIGWFTAMTYHNAAIVKSLGQIEFIFTLLITYFFFNEKISFKEYIGMILIMLSVIILLLT